MLEDFDTADWSLETGDRKLFTTLDTLRERHLRWHTEIVRPEDQCLSIDWKSAFERGLPYEAFLQRYGSADHQKRWRAVYDQVILTDDQRTLLSSFTRSMNVLCLAGAWCGDCVQQCPIFPRFAEACPRIDLRFVDRDADAALQQALSINGGSRVPVVVFLSEDFHACGQYGDRTLSRYRDLARAQLGAACPTGIVPLDAPLLASVTCEWLAEFERTQWMLRLSPRLRQKHGD